MVRRINEYSLRLIRIPNLDYPNPETMAEEALRVKTDFEFFGFRDLRVIFLVPTESVDERRDVNALRLIKMMREWEKRVIDVYSLDKNGKLVNIVTVPTKNPSEGSDEWDWIINSVSLPCLLLTFSSTRSVIMLSTVGLSRIVGILELLAPLVDPYPIFDELLRSEGGKGAS